MSRTQTRRRMLGVAALALAGAATLPAGRAAAGKVAPGPFPVEKTEAEWRTLLSDAEYAVLREGATARAFSSPLDKETRPGMYHCRGCDQALYAAEHKYDSGTGWPSFWRPVSEDAIGTMPDWALFIRRTEVHCSRCGGHQGHVFNDGPPPTGKRHCINGLALRFKPA